MAAMTNANANANAADRDRDRGSGPSFSSLLPSLTTSATGTAGAAGAAASPRSSRRNRRGPTATLPSGPTMAVPLTGGFSRMALQPLPSQMAAAKKARADLVPVVPSEVNPLSPDATLDQVSVTGNRQSVTGNRARAGRVPCAVCVILLATHAWLYVYIGASAHREVISALTCCTHPNILTHTHTHSLSLSHTHTHTHTHSRTRTHTHARACAQVKLFNPSLCRPWLQKAALVV